MAQISGIVVPVFPIVAFGRLAALAVMPPVCRRSGSRPHAPRAEGGRMRKPEASALNGLGVEGHCEIRQHAGGVGGYIIAVVFAIGPGGRRCGILTHEDGAALRFRDHEQARAMALRCGFTEDRIWLAEPPDTRTPRSAGER